MKEIYIGLNTSKSSHLSNKKKSYSDGYNDGQLGNEPSKDHFHLVNYPQEYWEGYKNGLKAD